MSEATEANAEVRLERLYLKDLSFESPASPEVFGENWQPQMSVDINTRINALAESRFEVVLTVSVRAKRDTGKTAFIVEVQQAGLFFVQGLAPDVQQKALGTICPGTLFPYLREAVDNVVVKGGFPALQLAPVNFEAVYAQAMNQAAAQAEAGGAPDSGSDPTTH